MPGWLRYYVTSDRVISEYRFISLRRQELPVSKIRAVQERKSIFEAVAGLGHIEVASGGGGGSVSLNMRNIPESTEISDIIRGLM